MQTIAWSLSNEERAQVSNHFTSMDTSQQGTITLAELKEFMLSRLNVSDQETTNIFSVLDSNQDELIHYSDFLAAMVETCITLHDDTLKQAFNKFDKDSSGFITADNMCEVLGSSSHEDEVEDLIREADLTNDNRISFPEFVAYVLRKPLDLQHQRSYLSAQMKASSSKGAQQQCCVIS